MRPVGISMWALGAVIFIFAAFVFDPSVRSYSSYAPDWIVNLARQQIQLLAAMAGLTLFLAGVIVHALSVIAFSREQRSDRSRPPPPGSDSKPPDTASNAELMAQYGIRPGDDGARI